MSAFGHGVVRLFKLNGFSRGMVATFQKSYIPEALVVPFSYILPFAELIVGLLLLTLPLKAAALFAGEKWRRGLELATKGIGILILAVMVQARSYLVPLREGSNLPSLANLAQVNYSLNLAFKIALAVCVIKFLWDLWEAVTRSRGNARSFVRVF